MAHQIRSFAVRVTTKVNLYPLVALGLALAAVLLVPGGGGGGGAG